MKKILITGFKPFFEYPINPTEEVIKYLNSLSSLKNKIATSILPVDYQETYQEFSKITDINNIELIILTGLSYNRDYFSLELQAKNLMGDKRPDNSGRILEQKIKINEHMLETYNTSFDIEYLEKFYQSMTGKYQIQKSYDAGTYLCNFIYFSVLANYKIPTIFIHVPASVDIKNGSAFRQNDINHFILDFINFYFEQSSDSES